MKANAVFIKNSTLHHVLLAKLGSGGEGTVYAVEGAPDICVKIYHEQKRTPELEAKLKAMIDAPPKDPTLSAGHYSICWPVDIVYEDEACTRFLGFIMPRIDRNIFKEYHLLCDKPGVTTSTCYRLEHFGTGFTYLHMYVVALNLASCVASIHAAGHAIGDLNDKNILVSTKDSKITIVDCDSFEIHEKDDKIFPCSVYMPEYSAPEVIQRKAIKNRQESDRFALSILIFKLLMLNTHPYASRGSSVEHLNTPGEKIAQGYYPYEEYAELDVNPPAYALPYDIIPPNIKALFRRCFVEGQHKPEQRPSAMEWFNVLSEYYTEMSEYLKTNGEMCKNNPLHVFPQLSGECPWCGMKEEYFPKKIPKRSILQGFKQMDDFEYIEKLLDFFLDDNKLTLLEEGQLYNEAKKRKIPSNKVGSLIENVAKNNNDVVLGDEPYISPLKIDAGVLVIGSEPKEYKINITNRYLNEKIEIDQKSESNTIKVIPTNFTLAPMQRGTFSVMLMTNNDVYEDGTVVNDIIELTVKDAKKTSKSLIPVNFSLIHPTGFYAFASFFIMAKALMIFLCLFNYFLFYVFSEKHFLIEFVGIFIFSVFFVWKGMMKIASKTWIDENNQPMVAPVIIFFGLIPIIGISGGHTFSIIVCLLLDSICVPDSISSQYILPKSEAIGKFILYWVILFMTSWFWYLY